MFELLARCPVFRGVSAAALSELFYGMSCQLHTYHKNDRVAERNQICKGLYVILKGMVKGEMLDASGKVIKIEDIAAPRPVAPAFIFGQNNRFPVDVTAQETTEILFIPRQTFIRLMQQNEVILTNYMNAMADRASFLSSKLYFFSFRTIRQKLAQYLLDESVKQSAGEVTGKSQQELADYFGVTRPALARVINELADENLICVDRKMIRIVNPSALKELLD